MSLKDIIDRLRKAEVEIDLAKMELATDSALESQEKEARELRERLGRLEAQVSSIRGEGP